MFGFPNLDAGLSQGIFGPNFMLDCSVTTVVTTAADSGADSLRQAIADACPGGTITFDASLNGQTITLTSGELVINRNLTITGPGANLLAVSGNNASRVFNIGAGATVTLQRFTVSNGRDADAGGIRNAGVLTVRDSAFTGNSPTNSRSAAIYNTGTLTVANSTFTGNSGATYGIIGAFGASGPLTLEQVTLSGNTGRGVVSHNSGAATLRYVTIAQSNNATAVFAVGQAIRLESSIIASASGGSACETISGSFASCGYNLISDATCALSSGTITVRGVVSAGADVSLTSAVFLAAQGAPASPPDLPPGVGFPYGLFAFAVTGLPTTGAPASVTFTLTYPDPLPAGTPYWKYGRTAAQPTFHWYSLPTATNNNQITFSVTDGGQGDNDLTFDGSITDPGGPGFGIGAVSIPTLSEWALLLLALLLGGIAAMPRFRHWPPSRR